MKSRRRYEYHAKLSGSENHKGFRLIDPEGFCIGEIMPIDQDGLSGQAICEIIVEALNRITKRLIRRKKI